MFGQSYCLVVCVNKRRCFIILWTQPKVSRQSSCMDMSKVVVGVIVH